jgi:hypothetical protein
MCSKNEKRQENRAGLEKKKKKKENAESDVP